MSSSTKRAWRRAKRKAIRNVMVILDVDPKVVGVKMPWRDRVIVAVRRRYNRNDF